MDRRLPLGWSFAGMLAAALIECALAPPAAAQPAGGPTYQRKGSWDGPDRGHHRDRRHHGFPQFTSKVSAGTFQRPYPYHLDYYKMKYGGSYAPYFGNLYGPPINNFFGTPFVGGFGGFGPGFGWGGPWGGEFGGYGGYGFGGQGYGGPGYAGPGYGGYGYGGPQCGMPYGPWAGAVEAPVAPVEGEVVEEMPPTF